MLTLCPLDSVETAVVGGHIHNDDVFLKDSEILMDNFLIPEKIELKTFTPSPQCDNKTSNLLNELTSARTLLRPCRRSFNYTAAIYNIMKGISTGNGQPFGFRQKHSIDNSRSSSNF